MQQVAKARQARQARRLGAAGARMVLVTGWCWELDSMARGAGEVGRVTKR